MATALTEERSFPGVGPDTLAAIRRASLDYIEGWYAADAAQMRRALHPDLAKRTLRVIPRSGRQFVEHMSASMLVEITAAGGGSQIPAEQRQQDVMILDVFEDIAVTKVIAARFVDYLQLARVNGEWQIVNVLWELKPDAS